MESFVAVPLPDGHLALIVLLRFGEIDRPKVCSAVPVLPCGNPADFFEEVYREVLVEAILFQGVRSEVPCAGAHFGLRLFLIHTVPLQDFLVGCFGVYVVELGVEGDEVPALSFSKAIPLTCDQIRREAVLLVAVKRAEAGQVVP